MKNLEFNINGEATKQPNINRQRYIEKSLQKDLPWFHQKYL